MHSLISSRDVEVTEQYLQVELEDGRIIATPISWYPELQSATQQQRQNYKLICRKTGIEWPDLDLHLSIGHMLSEDLEKTVA